jgi:hypothetical protein
MRGKILDCRYYEFCERTHSRSRHDGCDRSSVCQQRGGVRLRAVKVRPARDRVGNTRANIFCTHMPFEFRLPHQLSRLWLPRINFRCHTQQVLSEGGTARIIAAARRRLAIRAVRVSGWKITTGAVVLNPRHYFLRRSSSAAPAYAQRQLHRVSALSLYAVRS